LTIYLLDLFGVFVFAISGAMAADRRRMDLFGFIVIALLPALGGGTLRDMIIDAPVFWLTDPTYLLVSLTAAVVTFVAANAIHRAGQWLLWADAVGLSLFCVLGAAKTLALGYNPVIAMFMGVMTAVVGGIVRDVVCNEIPLILRQDVYATAAFAGAVSYVTLMALQVDDQVAIGVGAVVCFTVRAAALKWKLSLPRRGGRPPAETRRQD
jgi:uncharacterized membrane protein YeiH